MISDESSSDSETGRFKCQSKPKETKSSSRNNDSLRSEGRSRPENERFRRDFDRKRDHHERRSRERNKFARPSPVRRRHSRERSPNRRSRDRDRQRPIGGQRPIGEQRPPSKPKEDRDRNRSASRDKPPHSRSQSHKSPEYKRVTKEEVKIKPRVEPKPRSPTPERSSKFNRKARESSAESSPEYMPKRSEVRKPSPSEIKRKIGTPIVEENSSESEEVVAGSYYSMAPTVVEKKKEERVVKSKEKEIIIKEKSKERDTQSKKAEESSEIDSSDDERLRAKLLNLERELHRTRKKKHKKKHKKSSSISKSHDRESSTVEVSSTTDIDKMKSDVAEPIIETVEVSSTQKSQQKESSEEGEILSDDNSQDYEIEPTDLRHKLKRSQPKESSREDICGPALPPHLERRERSSSRGREGPVLPPHLGKKSRHIGPTISEEIRQRLAEVDPKDMTFESSDEDDGIGPLPAGAQDKMTLAHQRLEARALDMKIKKLEGRSMHGSDRKSREQWMLELPEGKAKILGLEARSFRAKAAPDMSDRSSWTDTPEEKARKAKGLAIEEDPEIALQREAKARHIANRDADQEKAIKKHKKKHKRDESLLDLHQKKLKKKKKKEDKDEGKKERRPFSRDVDLQVNRFDEAQKKSIIKKAQQLDTRFSRGEAKYL